MPAIIDPETMYVDDLPAVWSPVQWDQTPQEQVQEVEEEATARLLWAVDAPEAILRLLLAETEIKRLYSAPTGYRPEEQGDWIDSLVTFGFNRAINLERIERSPDCLEITYQCGELGFWRFEIRSEKVIIERV